jgi:hypothetical protein
MSKSPLVPVVLPVVLLLLPTALLADEVFVKGAGSITGRVVDQTATTVVIDVGGGTIGIPVTRVDRIVKAATAMDEFDARAARLGSWDLEGWRALGRWASRQGLEKQSRQAFERILAVEPDDAEAEAALGFVFLNERWVPEAVAYRAQGFVKFNGEWMLPAEAQLRLDVDAQERSAREADAKARADELEQLKADVQAQYDAEAAEDAEWRAEGAAWFYSHAYGCGGWCEYVPVVTGIPIAPVLPVASELIGIPVPASVGPASYQHGHHGHSWRH